jgi:exodeoxyribonuclease VIII
MSNYGIMLDLETVGTRATSAIVSIGATLMNLETLTNEAYYYKVVDLASSVGFGLTVDPGTIAWWEQQTEEARAIFTTEDKVTLDAALFGFIEFVGDKSEKIKIFGNGADFDNAILAYAYAKCGMAAPWQFYNNRCYRTIKAMYPDVPRHKPAIAHDAMHDAIAQARTLFDIIRTKSVAL